MSATRRKEGAALRVGLNLLHALPEIGGAWNYIAGVMEALATQDNETQYIAFVTRSSEVLVPSAARFRVVRIRLRAESRWQRVLFETVRLGAIAQQERLSCLHHFSGTAVPTIGVPAVMTLHDLLAFERPNPFGGVKRAYLRTFVTWSVRHAGVVAPVSESTARGVMDRFGVPAERIQIVRPAVNATFRVPRANDVEAFRLRHSLPERFWVYVAHGYAHKNHRALLPAIGPRREAPGEPWSLVLRGDNLEWFEQEVVAAGLGHRVRFLPRLSAKEMPLLYGAAGGLVFPSTFEGGGIPLVEAMACGCPVLAADIPAAREFTAGAARLFDPSDVAALAAEMGRFETDAQLRETCIRKGLEAVGRHRPEVIAASCHEAYRKASRSSQVPPRNGR